MEKRRSKSAKQSTKGNHADGNPDGSPDDSKKNSSTVQLTSVQAHSCARMLYNRKHIKFSQILEEFVVNYKMKPADMPYWPYGPYWPLGDCGGTLVNTPVLCREPPGSREPLWSDVDGKKGS